MASITVDSMLGGVVFSASPVIVGVAAGAYPDGSTFRQVFLKVERVDRTGFLPLVFSAEVAGEGERVDFDISSALRSLSGDKSAMYESFLQSSGTIEYGSVTFRVSAHDEYQLGGEYFISEDTVNMGGNVAIDGGLDEMRRLYGAPADVSTLPSSVFSSKPSGELFHTSMPYAVNGWDEETGNPVGSMRTLSDGVNVVGDRKVYAISDPQSLVSFRCVAFLNPQGVVETVMASGRFSEHVEFTEVQHALDGLPSFRVPRRIASRVGDDFVVLSMSSGYVDREWQRWWIHQFGGSSRFWVLVSGRWVPCRITRPSSPVVYDGKEQSLASYDFDLTLAVSGKIMED